MTLKIAIDKELCAGNGVCYFNVPDVFAPNDEGQSTVINPTGAPDDEIRRAARSCPMRAIAVTEDS
jgi:ferredoxin